MKMCLYHLQGPRGCRPEAPGLQTLLLSLFSSSRPCSSTVENCQEER